MKKTLLSLALLAIPTYANACPVETVAQLSALFKKNLDGAPVEEIKDVTAQASEDVRWKLYKNTDGTADIVAHVFSYPDYKISNKLVKLDKDNYAIKNERYNYVEPADSKTASDTAFKEIQTYFFCAGEVHLSNPAAVVTKDKTGYVGKAATLRQEFLKNLEVTKALLITDLHQ